MSNEIVFAKPIFVSFSKYVKRNSRNSLLINSNDYQTSFSKSDSLLLPVINDTEFYTSHNENLVSILNDSSYNSRFPISYQIKSFGLDNGHIFIYPAFEEYANQLNKKLRHNVLKEDFAVLDFLKANGIETTIEYQDNAHKNNKKLPVLNVCIYGFFLLAELIMQAPFHNDNSDFYCVLRRDIANKRITMNKRIRVSSNFSDRHYMDFIVTLNNNPYRLTISFVDLAGIHGNASLKSVMKNVGMQIDTKKSLDNYKDKMHIAYFDKAEDFDNYAIGDLNIDEVLVKFDILWKEIYKSLGIALYKEPNLTIGSSVGNLIYSKLIEKSQLEKDSLEALLFPANSSRLQNAVTFTSVYLSKVYGGLCKNNNPLNVSENGILIDIDIDGAYANSMMQQEFPIGIPLIIDYPRNKKLSDMKTLREFLKEYNNELLPGLWIAIVETKENLSFEQDFILSWFNLTNIKTSNMKDEDKRNYIKHGDIILKDGKIETKLGNVKVLTKQIRNGLINHDFLEYLNCLCSNREKSELLDKLIIKTAMIYPLSAKRENMQELHKDSLNWIETFNQTKKPIRNSIFQKIDEKPLWYSFNIGDLITKEISQKRKMYDKANPLNALYKLINNTSYGDMVSEFFIFSNVCVANNITARVRAMAWYVMKGLNTRQIITDGGVFNINKVLYTNRKLNQSNLTRVYADKKPWERYISIRPLGNYTLIEKVENDNEITLYGYTDTNKELIASGQSIRIDSNDYEYKPNGACSIASLASNHLLNLFPDITVIKQFKLAVKNIYDSGCFHAAANYLLENKDYEVSKMRAYEKKSKQWSIEYIDDKLAITDYYDSKLPAIHFLHSLKNNPYSVKRSVVFTKAQILTPGLFANNRNYWLDLTELNVGDDFYKAQMIREFSLSQFTYQTIDQINSIMAYERRYREKRGQSYESFFTDNESGNLNFMELVETIDECIRLMKNPYTVLNKHRHLNRMFNKGIHPNFEALEAMKKLIKNMNDSINEENFDYDYENYDFDLDE